MLQAIVRRGRGIAAARIERRAARPTSVAELSERCQALLSRRGEASGIAIAREILTRYRALDAADRLSFFECLADRFDPDPSRVERAGAEYARLRSPESLRELIRAVEPPRQELFRRLNQAPGATYDLVTMRADLLAALRPRLAAVDDDLVHLLTSWFNRGFLLLERITWSSPADLLERIIRYEAVHTIRDWDDLRRRLQPPDRRCYAFFHPSLAEEPLIFVEVALTRTIPNSISEILADQAEPIAADQANVAVFYSISNCQNGLRGISFGNLLIKQVVEELKRDLPKLSTFVTLSPAPGFGRWLGEIREHPESGFCSDVERASLARLDAPDWPGRGDIVAELRPLIQHLAAAYYLEAKRGNGLPVDPVARFHLGNGARLERINWPADLSAKGLADGAALMVNYLYDPDTIEENHEAYWGDCRVASAPAVKRLLARSRTAKS